MDRAKEMKLDHVTAIVPEQLADSGKALGILSDLNSQLESCKKQTPPNTDLMAALTAKIQEIEDALRAQKDKGSKAQTSKKGEEEPEPEQVTVTNARPRQESKEAVAAGSGGVVELRTTPGKGEVLGGYGSTFNLGAARETNFQKALEAQRAAEAEGTKGGGRQ